MVKKWTLEEWINENGECENEVKEESSVEVIKIKTDTLKSSRNDMIHKEDHTRLRHNRSRYEGFKIGYYTQTPPLIFSRDGHNIFLGDMYRGSCAFLILGGPSLLEHNLRLLNHPGILTMGVNNSVKTFRPNLWTCVDDPSHFIKSIWLDPTIQKIIPYAHAEKKIFDNEKWEEMDLVTGQCPNVFFYRRNEHFVADRFLFEDTINWGNHTNLCHCGHWREDKSEKVCSECGEKNFGSRSVMLPAIRLLFYLGVRTVFLLGCDFKMEHGKQNYHFDQDRSKGSVNGNNNSYEMLNVRFDELKSIFQKYGFCVFNCNKESGLKSFPFVEYEDTINVAIRDLPNIVTEPTKGLYDRKANEK